MASAYDYKLPELASEDGISPTGKTKRDVATQDESAIAEAVAPVIAQLDQRASDAMQRRSTTEQRWLRNLRQFHGQYEEATANLLGADDSRSRVFVNVTRTKTNSWAARIGDMLFPNDEKNWGIDPTPVPDLTEGAKKAVEEAERLDREAMGAIDEHNAAVEAGGTPPPDLAQRAGEAGAEAKRLRDSYSNAQAVLEEARERAKRMERAIDDQLTESRYPTQARLVIDDACKLGSGIVKGPILAGKNRPTWQLLVTGNKGAAEEAPQPEGEADENQVATKKDWILAPGDKDAPMYRRVNPWHFFPDPDAETLEDAEFVLERHLPNKKKLRRMAKEQSFDEKAVLKLLKDGPQHTQGSTDGLNFLSQLRSLENGGEGDDGNTSTAFADRYQLWEFYGTLEVEDIAKIIRAMGRHEDAERFEAESSDLDTHMVRIFFCDKTLLKIEENYLLDSQEYIYSVFPFEKSEASILGGVGVPELMEHEQSMLNSAVRMMMDNGALAVGPQVIIDKESVQPENGSWKLTPRKVWSWVSNKVGRKEVPFTAINIPINQEQLSAIIQLALRFIDEAVAMPLIAQGEQGQHITKTSSGMSMLFNSANVVFRRVIKNWDDAITTPTIGRAFDFNMQFSTDDRIKGDMQIEARGTSVLLVREMQAEQLMAIVQQFSTHPILGVAIKAYEAMKLVLQAMNINPADVLLERDEYLEKLKAMSEDEGPASDGEVRLQIAEIDAAIKREQMQNDVVVADMRMRTEMMQLAQQREIKLEEIAAMFKTKEFDGAISLAQERQRADSKERALAAEVAIERQNAREAREQGMVATGSGGAISLGREEQ